MKGSKRTATAVDESALARATAALEAEQVRCAAIVKVALQTLTL